MVGTGGTTNGAGGSSLGGVGGTGAQGGTGAGAAGGRGGGPGAGGALGGQAGSSGSGSGGLPTTGGTGGSPQLYAACERACERTPAACVGSQAQGCDFSCRGIATQFVGCQQEIGDYFDCLSKALDPSANCMLASNGDCYGDFCTTQATDSCADLLQIFSSCEAGCSSSVLHYDDSSCTIARSCPGHDYYSSCRPFEDALGYACACSIDGTLVEEFTLGSGSHDVCVDADAQCASIVL